MVNGEAEAECTHASLLGRYEVGRTHGEGNFSKVKYARHCATGGHFAIKLLDRDKILSQRIDDQASITHEHRLHLSSFPRGDSFADRRFHSSSCLQIRREIGTVKVLKHRNVVCRCVILSAPPHPCFTNLGLDTSDLVQFHRI
jgi:serine/threonine protein kinase